MIVTGIYKIPELKYAFFIVPCLAEFHDGEPLSSERKKRMECFERILQLRDHKYPKQTPMWTLVLVSEDEFLCALERHMTKEKESSNPSSQYPEKLELLAINMLKTPINHLEWNENSPVRLSQIPDEDIIEVFI